MRDGTGLPRVGEASNAADAHHNSQREEAKHAPVSGWLGPLEHERNLGCVILCLLVLQRGIRLAGRSRAVRLMP